MKLIPAKIHMVIDFLVVAFLLASPTLFGLTDITAKFTYGLAVVHLVLTLLTDFGWGILKLISFPLHGVIELLVGLALIGLAFGVFTDGYTGHTFYICFGIAVLVTWALTNYNPKKPKKRAVK